jgi:hypothetical protein
MPAPPPKIWMVLCRFWRLPGGLTRAWWQAVSLAQWSRAQELRQQLLLFQTTTLGTPKHLIHAVCAPAKIVDVIEDLVREGRLSRATGTMVEKHVLRCVSKQGTWC